MRFTTFGWLAPLRPLNRLAFLLLFQQVFEGIFVAILKLVRVEMAKAA
jgi:hypothetical protein